MRKGPVIDGDRTSNDIGIEGTMNLAICDIWDRADVTTRAMLLSRKERGLWSFWHVPRFCTHVRHFVRLKRRLRMRVVCSGAHEVIFFF